MASRTCVPEDVPTADKVHRAENARCKVNGEGRFENFSMHVGLDSSGMKFDNWYAVLRVVETASGAPDSFFERGRAGGTLWSSVYHSPTVTPRFVIQTCSGKEPTDSNKSSTN